MSAPSVGPVNNINSVNTVNGVNGVAGAAIWRSRALRFALAAFPLWCTVAVLVFNTPWRLRLVVGGLFVLTALAPSAGLLVLAAVVPLGRYLEIFLGIQPFRVTEALVMAFLAGWLVIERRDRDGPRVPAAAAWLLAVIVCASIAAQGWSLAAAPGELPETFRTLYQAYYLLPDRIGFGAGARLLEGLGLMAATAMLFRIRPRLADALPIAMTAPAVAAAASSVLLVRGIAPARVLAEYVAMAPRATAHVGDPNAAASYFAMMLFVALGMSARRPSAASILWLLAAATQLVALRLAASRTGTAVAALGLGVAAVCYLTAARRPRTRTIATTVVLLLVIAGGITRAWTLREDPGTSFRQQFLGTSLRMVAARPVLGLGVGRYYDSSALFLSPQMAWTYAFQNAHNHFLQVAAELGIVGLGLFLAVVGVVILRGVRAIARSPSDMRLLGCTLGAGAMLTTCLTGHPLLLDEVALPFWILLGLVAGLGGSVLVNAGAQSRAPESVIGGRTTAVSVAAALVALVAIGEVGFARQPLQPSASAAVTGLEPWESDAEGTRFRWTHDYASLFVPSNATRVYIPVRLPVNVPRLVPVAVDIEAGGIYKGRMLVGNDWAILNIELPPGRPLQRYKRVDLMIQRTWQPAVYIPGSSDLRHVGVQVGEIKEFFEY